MRLRTLPIIAAAALGTTAASAAGQGFGQTVHVTEDEVLVGESLYASRPGYVYIYRKSGGQWAEADRLQASDAEPNDHFGRTILTVQGDLLVGSTISKQSGALYVFRKQNGEWREVQSLVPANADTADSFGRVGATNGRVAAIADWAADESRGAVYLFAKQGDRWSEIAKLQPADMNPNDWFGFALSMDGDRLAISARRGNTAFGEVFIFEPNASGQWVEVARIAPPQTTPGFQFGNAIALKGDEILIGAPGAAEFVGTAFVYRRDASGQWTQAQTIAPPAGTPQTGAWPASLTVVGNEVWLGAPVPDGGVVLRLVRATNGEWAERGRITSPAHSGNDGFGSVVAANGTIAVAAAPQDDNGYGSVLILEQNGGQWAAASDRLYTEIEGLDPIVGQRVDCRDGEASMFPCGNVDMLSFLPVQDIGGGRGINTNDVWGWTDPVTGKEWALVGRMDGTAFIDISDPVNPVFVADLPLTEGARANAWRDIKVYRDHAYIVADGAGPHGMQVVDLTRLRDIRPEQMPLTLTEDVHYDGIASAHNIVINEETGYAYAVGVNGGGETCGGGLHMIDIREPKNPTFAGCFQDLETGNQKTGYTHDAQCVTYNGPDAEYRGREICFGANETMLSIADVTNRDSTIAISRAAYPNVGYAHQGWLDEQHEFFYMDDEGDELQGVPNTRTLVWDVRDLDDPVLAKEYFGPSTSSDHNLYVVGDLMYQSNYVSGLRIVDISDRANPREVGFFDTVPATDDPGFDGSWSNYPFFASGTIVVTSGKEGVFFLKRASRPVS